MKGRYLVIQSVNLMNCQINIDLCFSPCIMPFIVQMLAQAVISVSVVHDGTVGSLEAKKYNPGPG